LPPDFQLEEFVPKEIFQTYGTKSIRFVSPVIMWIAQGVRDFFKKPVIINNWHMKGNYNYSGFRDNNCKIGAENSAHKRGMAIDIKVEGISAADVQNIIRENYVNYFKSLGLAAMELDTPTWTHLSCENFNSDNLVLISV